MGSRDGLALGRRRAQGYVGLFKDDAVAVLDTAQNKVPGTIAVRVRVRELPVKIEQRLG